MLAEQLTVIITFCKLNHKNPDFVGQLHLHLFCDRTGKERLIIPLLIGPK